MDNNDIKKIAEEYVHCILDTARHDPNINDHDWQDMYETVVDDIYKAFQWLNERYYIWNKESHKVHDNNIPKYMLGQLVMVISSSKKDFINMITEDNCYELLSEPGVLYRESELISCSLY